MYRAVIIAIGMGAAAFLAAGCGGGGGGTAAAVSQSTSATSNLTKAEFIKQADAICSKVAKEREAAIESWEEELPGGPAEAQKNFNDGLKEVVAPTLQQEAEELEALGAPVKDAALIGRMIGNLKQGSVAVAERGFKGAAGSSLPIYEKEAIAFGLTDCSHP